MTYCLNCDRSCGCWIGGYAHGCAFGDFCSSGCEDAFRSYLDEIRGNDSMCDDETIMVDTTPKEC